MVKQLLALLPVWACAVQVQVQPHARNFADLKSTMLAFAARGKIDQQTTEAVSGFLKIINDDLLTALEADRIKFQAIYNDNVDAVNKCNTDRDAWFIGNGSGFTSLNTNVSDLNTIFHDCRAVEDVSYTNYSSTCAKVEQRVCNWRVCTLPAGGFENGDDDEVEEYMECIIGFCEENRGGYYTERTDCINITTTHHIQAASCDTEQGCFEDEYCNREAAVQSRCETYDTCRFDTETVLLSTRGETEDLEGILQAQFVALHHLVCYGEQILNNSTDLSVCDNVGDECTVDYPDACPRINYPTPLDFTSCDEPTEDIFPCTQAFEVQEYAQYNESNTPIADCHTCIDADTLSNAWGGARKTNPNAAVGA